MVVVNRLIRSANSPLRMLGQKTAANALGYRSMSSGGKDSKYQSVYGNYNFRKSFERGRQQYMVRNVLTAFGLAGLCASIYYYSLHIVKQEDFSDVPMPPEPTPEERAEFSSEANSSSA